MSCGCVGDVIVRHKAQRNNSTDCEAQCLLLPKARRAHFIALLYIGERPLVV